MSLDEVFMRYRVTKQFGRGSESPCAQFDDLNDAKLFVEIKLSSDASLNVKTIYKIYQGYDMLEEFNPSESGGAASSSTTTTSSSQGSGGKSSGATQRPTPFNTAPRPTGMPHKWLKDDDEDEKKK